MRDLSQVACRTPRDTPVPFYTRTSPWPISERLGPFIHKMKVLVGTHPKKFTRTSPKNFGRQILRTTFSGPNQLRKEIGTSNKKILGAPAGRRRDTRRDKQGSTGRCSQEFPVVLRCTPRGSCNNTLLGRVFRRFSNSKGFSEGFLEGSV